MPIQGINNQILELLYSSDKRIQNFLNTLKPGDLLNGRIIEIFPNENKGIINFKGYNVISQLPKNINIQKGDIINVIVYNINNKVYMKLNNLITNNNQNGILLNNSSTSIDILNILNSLKLPINEHNLFIAQNLIKYQLPINKENIVDINNSLINFLQKKGIDFKIFNIQNISVAKEIVLSNILKLNNNINEIHNILINQNQSINSSNLMKISEQLSNLILISTELLKWIPDIKLLIADGKFFINLNNTNQNNINDIILLFEKQNTNFNKNQTLFNKSDILLSFNNNSISVKFENFLKNFNELIIYLNKNGYKHIATNLNELFLNLKNVTSSQIEQMPNNTNSVFYNLKNIFDELYKNIFQPNNTKLNTHIKQISMLLNSFKIELQNIQVNNIINQNDFNKILNSLNKTVDLLLNINFENNILPKNFINIQNTLKQFIIDTNNILNFNNIYKNKINIPIPSTINVDIESIIESLIFLKSRNIETDNDTFINIMSKYLSNNMKLSNNLEKLHIIINNFNNLLHNNNIATNNLTNITSIIKNIENILNDISIKPDTNNLKSEVMLEQLKNFFEKSGLSNENHIKNLLFSEENEQVVKSNNQKMAEISIHTFHNNLKASLINLSNELNSFTFINIDNNIKKLLTLLKEVSNDILNNLNAIQLINHKQSTIDLIYAQIPFFLDTKYFNGELQIWYRKDGLKHELGKSIPINLLFILNTSNLGQIKLHLSVFKNQIDCIINTENEKTKQILTKNKNEFIKRLNEMNYSIKNFYIKLDTEQNKINNSIDNHQYINITNINLRA